MPPVSSPALIFDLDGTLVDTAPDLLGALNAVLVAEGRAAVEPSDLRHLVGHGARAMLDEAMKMTGAGVGGEDLQRLVDAFIIYYREHLADESSPFPGVVETLAALKAEGTRMAVLTNKPHELAVKLLPALKLDGYFDSICGAGRMSFNKPDARIFHHVVEELGGAGRGAVMIGDSITDLQTGRAAGAPVILLSYGYTPEPAASLGADAVADNFRDIPALARRLIGN